MVSIRRRKLLGLCSGRNSFLAPPPWLFEFGNTTENFVENTKTVGVHPLPLNDSCAENEVSMDFPDFMETTLENGTSSTKESDSSPSKVHLFQQFPVTVIPEIKRRKRHRRKHVENQEPCNMRGVYLKNAKWQAAIKVDKKQIHLGTVGTKEEAARLYDRAAFMCGREPNFELSEEEKQELKKFKWDEFLAMTRSAITHKKNQRRTGPAGSQRKHRTNDWEGEQGRSGFSASEDDILAP